MVDMDEVTEAKLELIAIKERLDHIYLQVRAIERKLDTEEQRYV